MKRQARNYKQGLGTHEFPRVLDVVEECLDFLTGQSDVMVRTVAHKLRLELRQRLPVDNLDAVHAVIETLQSCLDELELLVHEVTLEEAKA